MNKEYLLIDMMNMLSTTYRQSYQQQKHQKEGRSVDEKPSLPLQSAHPCMKMDKDLKRSKDQIRHLRHFMAQTAENSVIRFISLTRRKNGLFANFKVKGERGGTTLSASICVDTSIAEVDPADPLEKIIEECAKLAVREVRRSEYSFEGLANI